MNALEYKTKECVVGFIDILGSSKAIETDAEGSLNVIHKAYEDALSMFQKLFGDFYLQPSVKIFSDNIVVSVEYKDNKFKRSAFFAVAMMSAIVQVEFLKRSWLTRGGISSGSFFLDNVMVWGSALVKSYQLESMVAIYPRVVIDPKLIGELKLALPQTDTHCKTWIRQDKDGLFFIEFINDCLRNAELFALGLFQLIEDQIAENHNNPKVCQKWIWLSSYVKERLFNTEKVDGAKDDNTNEDT